MKKPILQFIAAAVIFLAALGIGVTSRNEDVAFWLIVPTLAFIIVTAAQLVLAVMTGVSKHVSAGIAGVVLLMLLLTFFETTIRTTFLPGLPKFTGRTESVITVCLIFFGPICLYFIFRTFASKPKPEHACDTCGYDLRAHNPGDKCPECGAPIPARSAEASR